MISLKSKREVEIMRAASAIVKDVLAELETLVKPGITTEALDRHAETMTRARKGIAAFKNYRGYPATICASVNDEVVHGIPSKRVLRDGDIISVDYGVLYNGYFSDAARTWAVGTITPEARRLIEVTRESFYAGVRAIQRGARLGDLSYAIQQYVEEHGCSVVRDFVGHGIGRAMHEEPQIPNYGTPGTGILLEPGMALAIEPMVNQGGWQVEILDNKWTVVTKDGSLSAHYENTIVVGNDTVEVLT